jgi:hypothetical protein
MAIARRETKAGPRFDVEWRLPDRSKRRKSFHTEREARVFEASVLTKTAAGDIIDPRGARVALATVYKSWLASRVDLSPKVRRGYEDIWRLRLEPRFGLWSVGRIDYASIQNWVNEMAEAGLSPRTVRWVHSVLKMCLDHAAENGQLLGRNPAARTKFPPLRPTSHTYLTAPRGRRSNPRMRTIRRRRVAVDLYRDALRRADRTQRRGRRPEGAPYPGASLDDPGRREAS